MRQSLKDRVAVVTGGASGIGLATAKRFAEEGARTYVLDLQAPHQNEGLHLNYLECNVADFESVRKAIDTIITKEKTIDCAFANAGIHLYGNIEETSLEDFEKVLSTNLKGTFHFLKCVLPIMRQNKKGAIVLMGSDQSLIGKTHSTAYGMTKGAIAQLAKSTAVDYGPLNIRVNCVCPGAIETPLYHQAVKGYATKYAKTTPEELVKGLVQKYPLQRVGQPEEVANLVLYLCSDEASFITGTIISVDGGYTAQ